MEIHRLKPALLEPPAAASIALAIVYGLSGARFSLRILPLQIVSVSEPIAEHSNDCHSVHGKRSR
jgi:hypothetical protein